MRPPESAPSRAVVREEEELRHDARLDRGADHRDRPADDPDDPGASCATRSPGARRRTLRRWARSPSRSTVTSGRSGPTDRCPGRERPGCASCACPCAWRAACPRRSARPCSYFGSARTHSPAGHAVWPQLILEELEAALDRAGAPAAAHRDASCERPGCRPCRSSRRSMTNEVRDSPAWAIRPSPPRSGGRSRRAYDATSGARRRGGRPGGRGPRRAPRRAPWHGSRARVRWAHPSCRPRPEPRVARLRVP